VTGRLPRRSPALTLALAMAVAGMATPALAAEGDPPASSGDAQAPPAPEQDVATELRLGRQGLGLDPGALSTGGLLLPPPPGAQWSRSQLREGELNYHGFLRAPMRIGLGRGDDVEVGVPTGPKLHSPPRLPDASYTDWSYTGDRGGPWTELRLSWGNAQVFGTVSIAAYNLSDAGYKDLVAQLGIDQAYVTINLPDLFAGRGGLLVNVGGFSGGYGAAGRYDAGAYGTYLFGRTHGTGETVSAFYDLTDSITLQAEHGIGARLDVTPEVPGLAPAPYLPYAPPNKQFPTLLHHGHLGATFRDTFRVVLHYLTAWTQSATRAAEPDGRITSTGVELKMIDTRLGSAFLGLAHLRAREAIRVAGALEVVHATEGYNLAETYFGPAARGRGSITSLEGEWTFSLATFLRHPQPFWGQGPDLVARVFAMWNQVDADELTATGANHKLKYGGSLTYTPLFWLGLSGRVDVVRPDLDDSAQSFQILSPRVLLRTDFLSHEEIVLKYDRYFLGSRTRLNYPFDEQMARDPYFHADENVFSLTATFWW
jgi:hypothetical protein